MAMLESRRILKKVKIFLRPILTYADDERVIIRTKLEKPSKIKGLALI